MLPCRLAWEAAKSLGPGQVRGNDWGCLESPSVLRYRQGLCQRHVGVGDRALVSPRSRA